MIHKIQTHWFSLCLIFLWMIVWVMGQAVDLIPRLANKGMSILNGEYYRLASSLLLHNSLLHVLANAAALFFVGQYLEPQISPWKLSVLSITAGIAAYFLFSCIYRNSISLGGSPIVFSLIGLIGALVLHRADHEPFLVHTWYGRWILGYALLSNLPLFSDNLLSTLLIHGLSLVLGFLLGSLAIVLRIL